MQQRGAPEVDDRRVPHDVETGGPAGAVPVRLYRIPEAMRMLSLSRSVIYEQIRAGRLRSVTQGRTRLVPAAAISDYVDLLMREADDGAA
jgi:excisionase family DNA binding protein